MERGYSIAEARNHLAALIHDAEAGSPVRITRRGRPVAVLLSHSQYERLTGRPQRFWEALEAFRATVAPEDLEGGAEVFEDVRDRAGGRDVAL
ncbi:MAG: type II toxin-antitoxin system Phd/YefM family antitoxin [Deferrisomatales bacterium]|nr:type II toxin-antitoxin system Phd/YefM family antitoxin [Deferrisomatales bacterium]